MKSHVALLLAGALACTMPGLAAAEHTDSTVVPIKVVATQDALRDLWVGHVFWVRNVVTARLAHNASQAAESERQVVANARAIAGAVEPYYGAAAADRLFGLLAGHWGAIDAYLDATLSDERAARRAATKQLGANANEIADFLSGANPHWPVDTLRALLAAHGAHHVQQIDELDAGQYEQEAVTWKAMSEHMYVIADALAAGIAKQFPEKFE